jgi:hypothetical protein
MDRRKSIKALLVGGVSAGVIVEACKPNDKPAETPKTDATPGATPDGRMVEEEEHLKAITAKTFFNAREMATITILCDIIIPKDEVSGSASDARVPDFIEFIVKEKPAYQVQIRGGLRWLDMQCLNRFEKAFADCDQKQKMEMVDEIAWPNKAKKEMAYGVTFFNLMRDLTATGFYTSKIGIEDVGYKGNIPNQWNGVPDDVLKQYGLAYTEKELKECASYS